VCCSALQGRRYAAVQPQGHFPLHQGLTKCDASTHSLFLSFFFFFSCPTLKNEGLSVLVIEGRDRVGGRTATVEIDGGIFDIGTTITDGWL
jgi:hypothetical protein